MLNQSRRKLLKGLVYGSALSIGGLSTAALVLSKSNSANTIGSANTNLAMANISIMQQKVQDKEIVTLINQSDFAVTLDKSTPVDLQQIDGSLMVKVNQIEGGELTLKAGERVSFDVETVSANIIDDTLLIPNLLAGHLMISSEHSAFNGIVSVATV